MATSYLTFRLANETYAVQLKSVSEIAAYPERIARVPTAPDWVRGVFNLRGSVVPAIDLCKRLGYESSGVGARTVVLIVNVQIDTLALVLGMVVDAVDDLLDLEPADIEAPPAFGSSWRVDCLLGTVRRDDAVVCVLDLLRMFKQEELLAAALSEERTRSEAARIEQERKRLAQEAARTHTESKTNVDMGREDPDLPGLFLFEEP